MSKKLLFLFSFFIFFLSCSEKFDIPDNKRYYEMSIEEFENYSPVKEKVIWGNIDFYLLNAAIFHKTNKIRMENNKALLQYSKALEQSAYGHSVDMIEQEFFSHVNPNTGKTPFDRMSEHGVKGKRGENIAAFVLKSHYNYLDVAHKFVYEVWWNSEGHRKNMLDSYTYLAAGVYSGKTKKLFSNQNIELKTIVATQNFATVVPE